MAEFKRTSSFADKLKEEINGLKSMIQDQYSIQTEFNTKLLAQIDLMKQANIFKMFSSLVYLVENHDELDNEIEFLTNLFSNINITCECGNTMKFEHPHSPVDHGISIHGWKEMWVATIPNHMPLQDDFNFSYTDEQKKLIGHPYFGLEPCGPVECLNFQGLWKYTLADFEEDRWHQIVTKQVGHMNKTGMMWSRYLLLPEEMSGLTIVVKLNRILGSDEDRFQLSIFAPENKLIEKNYSVPLPSVYLCVQLEMKLEQQYYISEVRQFEIRALSMNAVPDEFTIPFSNARTDTLPEIVLKFSKP